jgi:hypothetical protein
MNQDKTQFKSLREEYQDSVSKEVRKKMALYDEDLLRRGVRKKLGF